MSDLSPSQIEADLAYNRAALSRSLEALCDRFAPATLIAEGKSVLQDQARPLLSGVDDAIRTRPMTAAVVGVAMAALALGRRTPVPSELLATSALSGTQFEAITRWEDEGGPPLPHPAEPEEDWLTEAIGLKERSIRLLRQIDDAARHGLAPAAELSRHRAAVTAALVRDTTKALGRGLGAMTGAAREQALLTRERIYLNRLALMGRAEATVAGHPVAAGLALAAAGAALALLFAPTETEDRLLGEARDRLFDDVKHSLRQEAVRTSALASSISAAFGADVKAVGQLFGQGTRGSLH
jgi:hypothetical protein